MPVIRAQVPAHDGTRRGLLNGRAVLGSRLAVFVTMTPLPHLIRVQAKLAGKRRHRRRVGLRQVLIEVHAPIVVAKAT